MRDCRFRGSGGPRRLAARGTSGVLVLGLFLLAATWGGGGCRSTSPDRDTSQRTAERPRPKPQALTPGQRQKNIESFDQVWTTIRDKHWDPALGGLDWEAVRSELRPKVESAETNAEARSVMEDMISRLGQSHFGVIPASVYREVEADPDATDDAEPENGPPSTAESGGDGVIGAHVRVDDGKAIITKVERGLPADRAGVKPGWQVIEIDGRPVSRAIKRMRSSLAESHLLDAMLSSSIQKRLTGDVGDEVSVTFRDGNNRKVTKDVSFARPSGSKAQFGHLPPFYVQVDTRDVEPGVGYIALSAFFDPVMVMEKVSQAMEKFQDADGIILDLRGNPGGIGAMAMGIGSWFVTEPNQRLGTMQARTGSIHFVLNPRVNAYEGPVAVLVDEMSMSTSEILAGGLQDLGRARVFGRKTPGAALPSVVEMLPNGDGFQYAFANYTSTGGEVLEGRGVTPDEVVPLDRKALLAGRDPVIDAAVNWIRTQKKQAQTRPAAAE